MTPGAVGRLQRTARLEARRVAQTATTFRNWPELLMAIGGSTLGRGPDELSFHTRTGQTITLPNAPGARVPAYEVFAEDCYDLEWFLGDLAHRPIQVLEIGAHVGTFACRLAAVHPGATIDSFEPAPDTARYLRRNIEANQLGDRVRAHPEALAGQTGWASFEQEGSASGHNHLAATGQTSGTIDVPTLSFGDALARIGVPIDMIKMDCEGGEYDLVYKSPPELWASVQRLVLEYHDVEGESWPELRAWFADAGLHVVRDTAGAPGIGLAWLSRTPLPDQDLDDERSRLELAAYQARRVAQTPAAFANWREVLGQMSRERMAHSPSSLTFETRTGLTIETPNVPGARLPLYEQFVEDAYGTTEFLGDLRDRPIHVFDIGAHVGTFACGLLHGHSTATVTCFEPSSETASWLNKNLDANGFGDRSTVIEAALGGETGEVAFDDRGPASVHSGVVRGEEADTGGTITVATLSFDDAVAAAGVAVDFVKMDCEGGEYDLAYRSSPASWASVQRVVLEYHDIPGQSWADLRAWFASIGLHVVRQQPTRRDLGLAWLSRGSSPWFG